MKHADVLGWVSVLISIPAFLGLFFVKGTWIQGLLVVLLLLFVLGIVWYWRLPDFTLTNLEKILTIHDAKGEHSTLVRRARMRPNQKGLTEWWVRNMGGDGKIANILIDGLPPDERDDQGGLISVCKHYRHPLPRWRVFDTVVSCEMLGSYTQSEEAYIHMDAYVTKDLTITVEFPADRPCRNAHAVITFSGEQRKPIGEVSVSPGGRRATLSLKKPKLGAQYHLEWEW